jgi:prophage regulatory protein
VGWFGLATQGQACIVRLELKAHLRAPQFKPAPNIIGKLGHPLKSDASGFFDVPLASPQMEAAMSLSGTQTADDLAADSFLRLPEVRQCTGLSRSTLYRLIQSGDFPSPRSLGARAVGWKLSAVKDWCANRPDAREQHAA